MPETSDPAPSTSVQRATPIPAELRGPFRSREEVPRCAALSAHLVDPSLWRRLLDAGDCSS